MRILVNLASLLTLSIIIAIFPTSQAYAYIDPSSGSYALQILLAGFLGAAFTLKLCFKRVKSFFTGTAIKHDRDHEQAEQRTG